MTDDWKSFFLGLAVVVSFFALVGFCMALVFGIPAAVLFWIFEMMTP